MAVSGDTEVTWSMLIQEELSLIPSWGLCSPEGRGASTSYAEEPLQPSVSCLPIRIPSDEGEGKSRRTSVTKTRTETDEESQGRCHPET
jgi:hypothetical protein